MYFQGFVHLRDEAKIDVSCRFSAADDYAAIAQFYCAIGELQMVIYDTFLHAGKFLDKVANFHCTARLHRYILIP